MYQGRPVTGGVAVNPNQAPVYSSSVFESGRVYQQDEYAAVASERASSSGMQRAAVQYGAPQLQYTTRDEQFVATQPVLSNMQATRSLSPVVNYGTVSQSMGSLPVGIYTQPVQQYAQQQYGVIPGSAGVMTTTSSMAPRVSSPPLTYNTSNQRNRSGSPEVRFS